MPLVCKCLDISVIGIATRSQERFEVAGMEDYRRVVLATGSEGSGFKVPAGLCFTSGASASGRLIF